ncbi:flagellar hook-length control protein FliK [bacterium AH-315-K20]|nr:flagellar hook-length control protein FliK [bacterium AH-315-K20]
MTAFRAQVAQGLSAALRQGSGDVTLRLTPKALGELRIELRVRDGSVDARLRPATDEARGLLERSVDTLRHALEARGLRVGRIEIEQVPESKDGSLVRHQDQHPGGQNGRAGAEGEQGRHHPAEPGGGDGRGGAGVRHTAEDAPGGEAEVQNTIRMAGGPGVVYGVADGAARIVMVDALV